MDQEEKINWEKILAYLDGQQNNGEVDKELNQQELEILMLAEETNMSLNKKDPETIFPVEAGWEELQARYEEKTRRRELATHRVKRLWWMVAAAVVFGVIGSFLWQYRTAPVPGPAVESVASAGIKLTLDNGKTLSLDQDKPPAMESTDAVLKGNTLVYQREDAMPATQRESFGQNVLEVSKGKQSRVELSDGTVVWVNAGSKISYPTRFAASKREMRLEGEAFFEVSHNSKRPFIVQVKDMNIRVLGTSFNVTSFGSVVYTALENGKVNLEKGDDFISLIPGELGTYDGVKGSFSKQEIDLKGYTAWKNNEIYFHNTSLSEIALRLEREYDIRFSFEEESLKNLHFTIDMPKKENNIQQILNTISLSTNKVNFVIKGDLVIVKPR